MPTIDVWALRSTVLTTDTKLPRELFAAMNQQVQNVIDNFYTIADICGFDEGVTETLADMLGVISLRKQVQDKFKQNEGMVSVKTHDNLWLVSDPEIKKHDTIAEVPEGWRRQVGTMQLLDTQNTYVIDCGFRYNDTMFYAIPEGEFSNAKLEATT